MTTRSLASIKSRIKTLEKQLKQKEERKKLECRLSDLKKKVSEKNGKKGKRGSIRQKIRGRLGSVADNIDRAISGLS